jgi:hypothetical protein
VIRKAGLLESERREKWTYFRIHHRYLDLLQHLEAGFAEFDASPWKTDDERARERLMEREKSCCPGPIKLTARECQK